MTRRFFAPPINFENSKIILNPEETRHLRDVLRLREGEKVQVFDGEGEEFLCEIEKIEKQRTGLKIIEKVSPASPESILNLTLAIALLKGEKFDLVIQKACELGVSRVIPLQTKRSDIRLKDLKESQKKLERWQKIALEAAKQCGRAKLMHIEMPIDFAKFVERAGGRKILFAERSGTSFSSIKSSKEMVAIVGSEGGWEDAEIELAKLQGFQIVTLGGRILRAETAGIVVSALLQNHFGDLS